MTLRRRIISVLVAHAAAFGAISAQAAVEPSELVGLRVVGLKRIRMGKVKLGRLPPGKWRYLRADESF